MGGERRLDGRTALVTGASRGIGFECARVLAAEGAAVVMIARSREALARRATALGPRCHALACDLTDPDAVARGIADARSRLNGAPDIVVNSAGEFLLAPVERTSVAEFDRLLLVNLTAPFAFIRDFVPDMRARGSGHIVTIGSLADRDALAENAAYAASKHGVRALHGVLRAELRETGVRASLISPAHVDTAIWDDAHPGAGAALPPRARMLDAADVADAVRYAVTAPAHVNVDELRLSRA